MVRGSSAAILLCSYEPVVRIASSGIGAWLQDEWLWQCLILQVTQKQSKATELGRGGSFGINMRHQSDGPAIIPTPLHDRQRLQASSPHCPSDWGQLRPSPAQRRPTASRSRHCSSRHRLLRCGDSSQKQCLPRAVSLSGIISSRPLTNNSAALAWLTQL